MKCGYCGSDLFVHEDTGNVVDEFGGTECPYRSGTKSHVPADDDVPAGRLRGGRWE